MDAKWISVTVKAVDAETRTMEGMASTQSPDYGGDVVLASAWKASLRQWKKMKSRPKFLAYHKHSTMDGHSPVIGKILEMRITEDGLWFKAWFAETDLGEEHLYLYSKGAMDAFSVGFMPMEVEHDGEKIAKLLKKHDIEAAEGSVERVITQAHLLEVSCVVVGMNMEALVSASAEDEIVAKMLERLEKLAGLKPNSGNLAWLTEESVQDYVEIGDAMVLPEEFDFEDTEDIQELGPAEEEPEYDEDPLGENKAGWDETEGSFRLRIRDPGQFVKGTMRTVTIKKDKPQIKSVMGKLKPGGPMTKQNLMFPKDQGWTLSKAKAWVKAHPDAKKDMDEALMVLKDLLDLFKTLNVRFDCLESDLKKLTKAIESPDQPGEVEPAPKDEVKGSLLMGDLKSIRPLLVKARRQAGLE